jgi:hypothetical protein
MVNANMITPAGATKSHKLQPSDLFSIFGLRYKFLIGALVCCMRLSIGSSQREAFLHPWCIHRVSTVELFLDVQIQVDILRLGHFL